MSEEKIYPYKKSGKTFDKIKDLNEKIIKLEQEKREYEYTIAEMVQTREDYFVNKDIIKDKIKELKDLCLSCHFRGSFCKELKERTQCVTNVVIKVLENLLKEN